MVKPATPKSGLSILGDGRLSLSALAAISAPPPLFEPGEPHFWDDPYISSQMLKAHLDPATDAASRRPETIDRSVEWLVSHLNLRPRSRLLDLGCGPGLYASRFAARGIDVTGIDYSQRSIDYAMQAAEEQHQSIEYICGNYVEFDFAALRKRFDAAVLIYGDICVLSDAARDTLLGKLRHALVPGGYFAFDVTTPSHDLRARPGASWTAQDSGFWRPGPHLVLEQRDDYPPEEVFLERYLVIDESGSVTDYRLWYRLYTEVAIEEVLDRAGFRLVETLGDLAGGHRAPNSGWLGIVARPR